jgi:hypothetical protein
MPAAKFFKDNLALVVGLTLPVVMMLGFLIASSLPEQLSDPPKFDLVFSVPDYQAPPTVPVSVRLIVKDGMLKAQYTKLPQGQGYGNGWRKLYLYETGSRKVRQLEFGLPTDVDAITGTREDTVASTATLRLDTTVQSPDGYELSYGDGGGGGLLGELFFRPRYSNEPRLRKGGSSVPLGSAGQAPFTYGSAEFVGWVVSRTP